MRRLLLASLLVLATLAIHAAEGPRLDFHGDPLPPGAIFRLGTTRFRHGGMPTGVTFLDAKTLATVGSDGALRIWSLPTGRQVREISGLTLGRTPLASDGKIVVAVNREHHFAAWDATTGKPLRTFGYGVDPTGVGIHGDTIVLGRTTEVTVWDMDGQKPLRILESDLDKRAIRAVALSSDGQLTAVAQATTIRLYETHTGKQLRELPGSEDVPVQVLAFAPGKPTLLAATVPNGTTRLWDVTTGKSLHLFKRGWGVGLAFTPDGKKVALAGKASEEGVLLYDTATFREGRRFDGGPRYVTSMGLAISPDGKYLASSGSESTVQVWEIATGKSLHQPDQPQAGIRDMRLSHDGKFVLVSQDHLETRIWDVSTGKLQTLLPGDKSGVAVGWGKDGRALIGRVGDREATFFWHDPANGKEEKTFRVPQSIHTLALTPDAKTMAILTTAGGQTSLWDMVRGVELRSLERHAETDAYYGLAISPDGTQVATAGAVHEIATGRLVRTLKPNHGTTVNGVAFSPDGKTVATVSYQAVRLYKTQSDQPPRVIELPWADGTSTGWAVAFHPNGKHLAVGERDGVALIDRNTGKLAHRWTGQRGRVVQLAFTPDGKRLLAGGSDGCVLVWDTTTAAK